MLSSQEPRVPHLVAPRGGGALAKLASRSCPALLRAWGPPGPPRGLCEASRGVLEAPAGRPESVQPPPPFRRRGPSPLRQPGAGTTASSRTAPRAAQSALRGGRAQTGAAAPGGRGEKSEERPAGPAALSAVPVNTSLGQARITQRGPSKPSVLWLLGREGAVCEEGVPGPPRVLTLEYSKIALSSRIATDSMKLCKFKHKLDKIQKLFLICIGLNSYM